MNQTTQQLPASPAQRLADKIRARTNNGRDLIDLLHDIAQGGYDAPKSDRITASKFLFDRGFGKCPKQAPASGDSGQTSDPEPAPSSQVPQSASGPESPRLVTQVKDALHDALGPAPKVDSGPAVATKTQAQDSMPPEPFDPSSIQDYIIEITNDGDTLVDSLMEIAYADADDPTVTSRHRSRAGRILSDRFMGTNPPAVHSAVCPECRRKWTAHPGSHAHPESHPGKAPGPRMSKADPEALAEARAEIQRMKDEGILTPDPNAKKIDITPYLPPDDFDLSPYAKEEAAKFWANIELRYERQQQWPAIEERRRKKLAQIYPSHSDGDPPDQ